MLGKATIFLLAVTTAGINASHLANFVPRDLDARTVNASGGWSLSQTAVASCPVNNPGCGATWCCPNTLVCIRTGREDIAEVCCPTDTDCSSTFTKAPACADSSWSLWDATFDTSDSAGYFCCLQDQVGLQSGACGSAETASDPQAILLASGTSNSTTAASHLSTRKSNGTSISTEAAAIESTAATSAPKTSVAKTTPAGTSSSASAATSVAAAMTKGVAVGFNSLGGTCLGGAVIAMALL